LLWFPGMAGAVRDGWCWWCVGLLFEICIVDASIYVAARLCGGVFVCGVLFCGVS
jgi:hypothetical protein